MTRQLLTTFSAACLCVSAAVLSSCDDEQNYEGTISGTAMATVTVDGVQRAVNEVHPGDVVTLTIGGTCTIEVPRVSGIAYPPDVHYLIDGKEVALTNASDAFFSVSYQVEGLAPGAHTLSVDVPQIYNNIKYNVNVQSSTFQVVEAEAAE